MAGDFLHLNRQRQCVVRVFEQIVIVNDNRVELEASRIGWQAKWTFVTDEVHFVSKLGKMFTQGRCDDSAPAH